MESHISLRVDNSEIPPPGSMVHHSTLMESKNVCTFCPCGEKFQIDSVLISVAGLHGLSLLDVGVWIHQFIDGLSLMVILGCLRPVSRGVTTKMCCPTLALLLSVGDVSCCSLLYSF